MRTLQKIFVAIGLMLACSAAYTQTGYTVGTWGTSPVAAPAGDAGNTDTTLREVVHVSIGGSQLTVTLSNEFGTEPLTIGEATVACRSTDNGAVAPVALLFGGKPSVIIPPGARATSDLAALDFPALSDLTVSLFIPAQKMSMVSQHNFADTTTYTAPGNQVNAKFLATPPKQVAYWRYLRGIDVATSTGASIICLGDSITDGARSTKDSNFRWPDVLAARLQANKATANLGIVNEGIGGNRVLNDGTGPSIIARLDRDVFNNKNARYLVIMEGINDIGHAYDLQKPYDKVTADDLIAAYHLMALRAHEHGLKVYGATLTPYDGAGYEAPDGEKVRQALNTWIRSTKELDGVIDFEKATRDPANPGKFLPAYDSGDHLHPNDAGYKAMGNSIDLKLFEK